MRKTSLIGVVILIAGLLAALFLLFRSNTGMVEFQSQEGNFKVRFPRRPTARTNTVKGEQVQVHYVKDDDGFFMIQFQKKPNDWITSDDVFKDYFHGWIRDLVEAGGGKGGLKKHKFFRFANRHPSVDCDLVAAGVLSRMRVVYSEEIVYNLAISGSDSWPGWKKSAEFFDSFQILSEGQ